MKTLCITGTPGADFDRVSELLFASGLASAKPIERESTITFTDWHARMTPVLDRQQAPGRLWEQLAGDLLLANLHQPQWGWADPASIGALDFWAELEPNLSFLLLSSDPQDYLASHLLCTAGEEDLDEQACLQRWRDTHERMLAFYLAYPERCVLAEVSQAWANPSALAANLKERCQIEIDPAHAQLPTLPRKASQVAPHALARYVADRALVEYGQPLKLLCNELQAVRQPLAEHNQETDDEGNLLGSANLSLISILKDYQQRCARDLTSSEREALERLRLENQRLLRQLGQVQNEMDAALLQHQESSQARVHAEQAVKHAKEERDANSKLLSQVRQQLAELTQDRDQIRSEKRQVEQQLEDTRQEAELLLLRLHQAQEDLEETLLEQQESAKAREEIKKAMVQSEQVVKRAAEERDANSKLLAQVRQQMVDLTQERDQVHREKRRAEQQLEDTRKEAELLLLRLHQVQEELEHHLLEKQKLEQRSEEDRARWQRMLQRNPDYSDYQSVRIQASDTNSETLHWRFEQLDIAGREVAQLNLNTSIERDMAVIELTRDGEDDAPLLAWPTMYADKRTLALCLPSEQDTDTIALDVQLLQSLTQSDWQLVQRLPHLLERALGESDLSPDQQQRYRKVLHTLQEALDNLPPMLRFDQVTLRNAQVNPDYEHLWLDLEHAGWGNERRETWSLRFSCANVGLDQFGTHPKLEIPEQSGQWLESWFEESRDDFGPKWELRFALPDAMDIGVWNKLSEHDQILMVNILQQLPTMLEHLQGQDVVLARNWQEWHQLVDDTLRIHKAVTHATEPTRIGSSAVL
ncbi:hypothetical protein [Salinicola peritrichatus]|uniref:hypothetical protein n=1 Tax=Salinicola peritrichatus TaxID=1267424 RepID=UPI000DA11883|nr:hypothetical protein [Salinicola peritrichatus]